MSGTRIQYEDPRATLLPSSSPGPEEQSQGRGLGARAGARGAGSHSWEGGRFEAVCRFPLHGAKAWEACGQEARAV